MSEQIKRYYMEAEVVLGKPACFSYERPDAGWCKWSDVAPLLERLALAEAEAKAKKKTPLDKVAVEILNEALAADRDCIQKLILLTRIKCNEKLASHHSIICGNDDLGFLGLLNGVLLAANLERIEAVINKTSIKRFQVQNADAARAARDAGKGNL